MSRFWWAVLSTTDRGNTFLHFLGKRNVRRWIYTAAARIDERDCAQDGAAEAEDLQTASEHVAGLRSALDRYSLPMADVLSAAMYSTVQEVVWRVRVVYVRSRTDRVGLRLPALLYGTNAESEASWGKEMMTVRARVLRDN